MATTFETNQYKSAPVFAAGFPGVIDRTFEFTVASVTADASYAFADDDVIKIIKLPQGAKFLYARLEWDVLDDEGGGGSTTMALEIYDGTDAAIAKTIFSVAAGDVDATGIRDTRDVTYSPADGVIGYVTDNENHYIRLHITDAASGGDAADDAKINVSIGYTQNVESNEYIRDFPTPNP